MATPTTSPTRAPAAPPPVLESAAVPPSNPSALPADASAPEPHVVRPLSVRRITLSHGADGSLCNIWTVVVEDKTPIDDIFDPVFFSNEAVRMKCGDIISVLTDTGKYDIGLRVRQTYTVGFGNTPNRVRTYKLWFVEPPPLERHVNEFDLEIKHQGPHQKWCLMRGNTIVQAGYDTQADAERARRNAAFSRNTPPKG
jgi:hypothetical protein